MTRGPRVFNQCNRRAADPAGNRIERSFLDVVAGDDLLDVMRCPSRETFGWARRAAPPPVVTGSRGPATRPEVSSISIRQRLKFPP